MKRRWTFIVASVVLGTLVAGGVSAQPRPMPPDPYDPQNHSQAPASNAGNFASQPALPASNDYPAAEVQAVPGARVRFAVARAEFQIAQSSLIRVIDQLKEDFEFSADFAAAVASEDTAYDHYATARDEALSQVESTSDYQTLKSFCVDLNEKLFNLNANPSFNRAEIVATAQLKLAYAKRLSAMESAALKADSQTQDAKARLVEAAAKVSQMRAQFARSLRRDQKFLVARKELDNARVARVAATAMLDGAIEARDIAVDYAYWLHRYDPYTYRYTGNSSFDPYSNSGYGYGVGVGYGGYSTIAPYVPFDPHHRAGRWQQSAVLR